MASYKDNLPAIRGGGDDTLGSILSVSTTVEQPVLQIGEKTYLREGYSLTPTGGDEVTYADAFQKLSSKDGKSWNHLTSPNLSSHTPLGIFKSPTGGVICVTREADKLTFNIFSVNIEKQTITPIRRLDKPWPSYPCDADNVEVVGNFLYIPLTSGYLGIVNLTTYATSISAITGASSTGLKRVAALREGFLILFGGYQATSALCKINLTTGAVIESSSGTFPNQGYQISQVMTTADKLGNTISIALTSFGDIFWIANMTDTLYTSWVKRYSLVGPKESNYTFMAYSAKSDLVYYGNDSGEYMSSNLRVTSLDGGEGPVVLTGKFSGPIMERYCSWFTVGDEMFFIPGTTNIKNFYKFNNTTRSWESFRYQNKYISFVHYPTVQQSAFSTKVGNVLYRMGGAGGSSGISTGPVIMYSKDEVLLPIDLDNASGESRYMRIK